MQYHCYPDKTHVAAGSVVQGSETLPKVGCHIWIKRKPIWFEIPEDGVERWQEFDLAFEEWYGKWKADKRDGDNGT